MQLRNPLPDETIKVYRLWQQCFHDPKRFADFYFGNLYKPQNTLCLFDGDKLVASLQIFYHTAVYEKKRLRAAYIAGVSTHPSERNKGFCSRLMAAAEERLRNEKIDIITLIPFKFGFYEKYGYRCASYLFYYHVKCCGNRKFCGTPCGEKNTVNLYSEYIKQFDFAFERDEKSFTKIAEDVEVSGGDMYSTDGGYMYIFRPRKKIYVPEIVYSNEKTLFSMLSYIEGQGLPYTIRGGANLLPFFSERDVKIEIKPHLMIKELTSKKIKTGFCNYVNMLGCV